MSANQQKLLEIAQSLIGTPYKYAAKQEDIPKFLDCSSFTQEIYKRISIEIPRSTLLQAARAGREIELTTNNQQLTTKLEVGDLLFFRGSKGHYDDSLFPKKEIYIGHVAVSAENGKVLHGSSKQGKIVEENLNELTNKMGGIVMIKRIL